MDIVKTLAVTLFGIIAVLCLFIAYRWVDFQSAVVLSIFNFLFISVFSQLNGSFYTKLGLLLAGNFIGVVWNYLFHVAIFYAAFDLTSPSNLNIFYTLSYPFLNSLWVISFWSLSLTAFHFQKSTQRRVLL
jgi:hypothetical protein